MNSVYYFDFIEDDVGKEEQLGKVNAPLQLVSASRLALDPQLQSKEFRCASFDLTCCRVNAWLFVEVVGHFTHGRTVALEPLVHSHLNDLDGVVPPCMR